MSVAISITGGDAHGAWFEGHQLDGAPETIRIAIAIDGRISLLDLPDDALELGEREVIYRRVAHGHICRVRGRGCVSYASYVPDGLEQAPFENSDLRRKLLEDAGVRPRLRLT